MAINDPYDRSGQYADGDRGSPLSNYGGLANDNPDRRDVAVGTMMGEGGPTENNYGYAAVLDSLENRIAAVQSGAIYGRSKNDSTLESLAKGRKGAEYNAWSPTHKDAYGHAQAGQYGNPKPGAQSRMYDQAIQTYDDYYDGVPGLRGVAQGGTFYQNASSLTARQAKPQKDMQREFGAVPVGIAGHVMTGPGLYGPGSKTGRAGPGYQSVSPAITGSFGGNFSPSQIQDALMDNVDVQSFTGQQGINSFGNFPQNRSAPRGGVIKGGAGTTGLRGGSPMDDQLFDFAQGLPPPSVAAAVRAATGRTISTTPPASRPAAPAAAPQVGPRESYWTPGPVAQAAGSTATGLETRRTPDGVIHDKAGAYGGGEAFGPNDPFSGLGFNKTGYADVLDKFDAQLGITRTVKDRQGNIIDQMTVGGKRDGGATGLNESGSASVGDGSYSESSGRNDNNPQGIL